MGGILRIARQEAVRYLGFLSPRMLLAVVLVGVVAAFATPWVLQHPLRPEAGLYRAEVNPLSPYLDVLRSDAHFEVLVGHGERFAIHEADLLIDGIKVYYARDEKGAAAAHQLEVATRRWLDNALLDAADQDAAFPISVNLVYQSRDQVPATAPTATTPAPTDTTGAPAPPQPALVSLPGDHETQLTPNQIEPPFPMRSLVLTFAYLIPLNIVGQLHAGTLWAERVRQRGLLLLSAPVSGVRIFLGKSLPYAAALVLVFIAITIALGAGLQGGLALLPVLAFGLASSALFGLLARSPRELTFLLVSSTVLLSTFLFLPAIFTTIHPVAFLSPISVLVSDLRGDFVPWGTFLYATVPLTVVAMSLGLLAAVLYREESLFAPTALLTKVADAIGRVTSTRPRLLLAAAATVPFTIGLELFLLIFAVTLEVRSAFIVFLLGGAFVEESFKGLVTYARTSRGVPTSPWIVGALVGGGFFLGEKLALVFTLVGFQDLPQGHEALATFGVAASVPLLLAPLVLHAATATLVAFGARKSKSAAAGAWLLASILHAAYNAAIVTGMLGRIPG